VAAPERWEADQAVVDLYAAHYRSLVRTAALLLRDPGAAEEVVQDAFVDMHRAWRRLREPDKAVAYLRQTVINGARSRLRRAATASRHAPEPLPDAASAEQEVLVTLERRVIMDALGQLPTRQREALVLRYYADMSEAAIAAAMGITPGAVKTHASRGIAALRTRLEMPR